MPGPKTSQQRAKLSKHLRTTTKKKFKNDSTEARAKYALKMSSRISRRLKKKAKRK